MEKSFHRRNLPHLYFDEGKYFVTYRLANSIPVKKLREIKSTTASCDFKKFKRLFDKYDSLMHSSEFGINYLQQKEIAEVCKTTLLYSEGKDYKLICYCIMPNHVHLVFELLPNKKGISKIMQSIKGISAKECNIILKREGKFWQDESYDRWIRNDIELYFIIRYVLLNPVNAGLVSNWCDWEYTYCNPNYMIL